ncbi:MAG: prepilin-type N-terminal cleavage/methylation domain-containing protein [Opitutales bacterium]|nr:prepilin-type N-terminal cleavage/methylation domain-containing protein [Opitutales bacterium]
MRILFRKTRGFSLIEVLLAVGVFAVAVLGLVGLLGPLLSDLRAAREEARADEIMAAVQVELRVRSQRGEFFFEDEPPFLHWIYFRVADGDGMEDPRLLEGPAAESFTLAIGERYASDTFKIRALPKPVAPTADGRTAFWAWSVEVRQWPAPSPDSSPAWPEGRADTLSPVFVFPAIARP